MSGWIYGWRRVDLQMVRVRALRPSDGEDVRENGGGGGGLTYHVLC